MPTSPKDQEDMPGAINSISDSEMWERAQRAVGVGSSEVRSETPDPFANGILKAVTDELLAHGTVSVELLNNERAIGDMLREENDRLRANAQAPLDPCPYAIDGCVLENGSIGPCLCVNPVAKTSSMPSADRETEFKDALDDFIRRYPQTLAYLAGGPVASTTCGGARE